jgi:membrane protease YdiL (CAAX protease family)
MLLPPLTRISGGTTILNHWAILWALLLYVFLRFRVLGGSSHSTRHEAVSAQALTTRVFAVACLVGVLDAASSLGVGWLRFGLPWRSTSAMSDVLSTMSLPFAHVTSTGLAAVAISLPSLVAKAIAEEFIFRFVLFQKLRQTLSLATAAMLSAAVFAAIHLRGDIFFFVYFLSGVVLAILYARTNRFVVPVCVHVVNNLVLAIFSRTPGGAKVGVTHLPDMHVATIVFLLLPTVFLAYVVWRCARAIPANSNTRMNPTGE